MPPAFKLLLLSATAGALMLGGCGRERRGLRDDPPPPPAGNPYGNNAWAISEGAQLYRWFNCQGCHAVQGGGGMGPPLMDHEWIYGQTPAEVFASIADGRPNGMPSFRARMTDRQIWQLVNHVLSLAGQVRMDARSGRHDGLNPGAGPTPPPPHDAAKRGGHEP
jgi:cytochrome c oxidase cbb3-type subunit 3